MRRRDFIQGITAFTAWPLAARAQQAEPMRRIGVLMNIGADDPDAPASVGAFSQGLAEAGWVIGRNVRIDYRWYQGNAEAARAYAAELLALTPDIILASGTPGTMALKQLTRTVPIVFALVTDPVVVGIVDSLARPGGNATGFMPNDLSFGGKWMDLLKQIAPHITRVAVFRDNTNPAGIAMLGVIQAMAPSAGLQVTPINVRNGDEIASAVEAFAHSPNGGAIVTGNAFYTVHRDLILKLIARYKLPDLSRPLDGREWWPDLLRNGFRRHLPARGRLC
jgi:putative ABC transport system substrate-binding protein